MKIDKRNDDYIAQFWERIAACAWKEYQAYGRGALLVDGFAEADDSVYLPLKVILGHPLTNGDMLHA
jgi:hypothetical protein